MNELPSIVWQEVVNIFLAAVELPEGDRPAFLAEWCGENTRLRAEVESLLAHDEALESRILDGAIHAVAGKLRDEDAWIGKRLGPYRLEEQIGQGGMGTVFLAKRADDRYDKRVAVKLVKGRHNSAILRQRLVEERRILANLEHPYIARLLDAGETDDGVPYLVMEYIDGVRIDQYVAERKPSWAELCRLLGRVCEAVAHAHQNLIVHRDLKPSNILITDDGTPKLLDFGIAGLMTGDACTATLHAFTPGYAAPEVVKGEAVTTAADTFSLGALMTGLLQSGGRSIPDDLASIARKANARMPVDRYVSVEKLVQDLDLWVRGFPVEAGRKTFGYRMRLFVARNRWNVFAATLTVLVLSGTTAAALWQAHRAEQRSEQLVRLAGTTVTGIHDTLEKIPGATQERRKIVSNTLRLLEEAQRDSGDSLPLLATVADGYQRMGMILGGVGHPNLGDSSGAAEMFGKAAALARLVVNRSPEWEAPRSTLLTAQARQATLLVSLGREAEARAILTAALRTNRQWIAQHQTALDARLAFTYAQLKYAQLLDTEEPRTAMAECDEAIASTAEVLRHRAGDPEALRHSATAYSQKYELLHQAGDTKSAFETVRNVARIREVLSAQHPEDVLLQRELMIAYSKVADAAGSSALGSNLGDIALAYQYHGKSIAVAERLRALDPASPNARFDAATAVLRAGMIEPGPTDRLQSMRYLQSALQRLMDMRRSASSLQVEVSIAAAYEFIGRRHFEASHPREGMEALRTGLATAAAIAGRNPASRAAMTQLLYSHLVMIQIGAPQASRAEGTAMLANARRALQGAMQSQPPMARFQPRFLEAEGDLFTAWGDRRAACGAYTKAAKDWDGQSAANRRVYGDKVLAVQRKLDGCGVR